MHSFQKLIIIRHPQTEWEDMIKNPDDNSDHSKRLLGSTDIGLSKAGKKTASKIGKFIKQFSPSVIYTSSSKRAEETAALIVQENKVRVIALNLLREIDFGKCEGLTFSELKEKYPKVFYGYIFKSSDIIFPGGESFKSFKERIRLVTDGHLCKEKGNVIVVTHGGSARVMISHLLKLPDNFFWQMKQDHGAINILSTLEDMVVLEKFNFTLDFLE